MADDPPPPPLRRPLTIKPPETMTQPPNNSSESVMTTILNSFSATSDQLDATELSEHCYSRNSTASDGDDDNDGSPPTPTPTATVEKKRSAIASFWQNHITVTVPGEAMRDHLALERTFLAYLRTTIVLTMLATVVAQLHIINHAPNPDPKFGFFVIGKPLAIALVGVALMTNILGAARWWNWQRALLRGKALSGGWEMVTVGVLVFLLVLAAFGLILSISVKKIMT